MSDIEVLLLLLAVTTFLVAVSRRIGLPYPILLVLGGLLLSAIPGIPNIELKPDYVFVLILPPILQSAAFFTPIRDFKAHLRPILSLAIGLVIATTCAVAVVIHALVTNMSWADAFILGAIVAPPDAVAATTIAERLGLPRRIVTILEGESLVNDGTALVTYRVAVTAALTGSFSIVHGLWEFFFAVTVGVGIGILAGWLLVKLLMQVEDSSILIAITILAPYVTYLAAEHVDASGVLAVVAEGLILGRGFFRLKNPAARIQSLGFWDMFIFLLNGFVFILIGEQMTEVLKGIQDESASALFGYAVAICLTAIVVRFAWVFLAGLPWRVRMLSDDPKRLDRKELLVVSWVGMRGAVSLAAALALDTEIAQRDLIIFLTFCVILFTLVGQGLTLAPMIRWLGIGGSDEAEHEEMHARLATTAAAAKRLETLSDEEWIPAGIMVSVRKHLDQRMRRLQVAHPHDQDITETDEDITNIFMRLQRELLAAEMEEATRLRDEGVINDETLRRLQFDFDVETVRLDRVH